MKWVLIIFVPITVYFELVNAECVDKVSRCPRIGHFCNHAKLSDTIKSNCPKTCGLCGDQADKPVNRRSKNGVKCVGKGCKKSPRGSNEKPYPVWFNSLDEKQDPCEDFYKFTCGKFIKNNKPKTLNEVHSPLNDIAKGVSKKKLELILDNSQTTSSAVQKLRQYRDTCKNQSAVESERTTSLRKDINSLGGCPMLIGNSWNPSKFDLTNALIGFTHFSVDEFIIDIVPDKMTDGKMYLRFWPAQLIVKVPMIYNETNVEKKIQYLEDFLVNLMSIVASDSNSQQSYASISQAIKEVINLDKKFADVLAPIWPAPNDPEEFELKSKKVKFSELKQLIPSIDWIKYMKENARIPKDVHSYLEKDPYIFVYTKELFQQFDQILKKTDKRIMANYLFTRYVVSSIPYLDSRFSVAGQRFAQQLDGFKHASSRDQDCVDTIEVNFPLVVDHLFVQKHFNSRARAHVSRMVEDLRFGLSDVVSKAKWMGSKTKAYALKKLKKTRKVVAAVNDALNSKDLDKRYSFVKFNVQDSYRQMAAKVVLSNSRRQFLTVVRPELYTLAETMRTSEVNALNVPDENLIFISSAISQIPMFDPKLPASVNYGGLGFIVGHETTHSLDNDGSKYDENGEKKNWWDSSSKSEFKKRSDCFVKQYGRQREKDMKRRVDGKKTLGENIADNGGMRSAFKAYQRYLRTKKDRHVPGYLQKYTNEQSFFISAGVAFCQSAGKSHREFLLEVDEHSPNPFRINVVLSNLPEFAKVFKCRAGTPMNPKKKCEVW